MKRIFMIACVLALFGLLAACAGGGNNAPANVQGNQQQPVQQTPAQPGQEPTVPASPNAHLADASNIDLSERVTITITRRGGPRDVNQENMFAAFMLERFNAVLDVTDIANADYVTRMNLMFAAGEADDVSIAHRPDFMLNDWIEAGYLRAFTYDDVQRLLPNYVNHFAPGRFPVVWASNVHSDGFIYRFAGRRAQDLNMTWMYRADVFEELNLTFPNNTEDLFDILVQLREATGMYPIVEADPDSAIWAFAGWLQAFGMPELSARDISMVDPRTGEFIPFIFATDMYRDVLRFLHRLYENDVMWPEFATGTAEQRDSLMARGHRHVIWGWPEQIPTQLNDLSQTENPNARWEWSRDMISADPASGHFFKMDPFFAADGVGFSADASDIVVERFLYILNWLYSDEGMRFTTFGIEGVHHEVQAPYYRFLDHMSSPQRPAGHQLMHYGWVVLGVPHHHNQNAFYRPVMVELAETFVGRPNYYYHVAPIIHFTAEETRALADIQTLLNQTRDQYFARFIMGHVDINDDAAWNNYISTMNALGLERAIDIRTEAFQRTPQP